MQDSAGLAFGILSFPNVYAHSLSCLQTGIRTRRLSGSAKRTCTWFGSHGLFCRACGIDVATKPPPSLHVFTGPLRIRASGRDGVRGSSRCALPPHPRLQTRSCTWMTWIFQRSFLQPSHRNRSSCVGAEARSQERVHANTGACALPCETKYEWPSRRQRGTLALVSISVIVRVCGITRTSFRRPACRWQVRCKYFT